MRTLAEHSRVKQLGAAFSRANFRKAASTVKILFCLGMARTFGEYHHSIWDGRVNYAVYRWRGRTWAIPTTPMES